MQVILDHATLGSTVEVPTDHQSPHPYPGNQGGKNSTSPNFPAAKPPLKPRPPNLYQPFTPQLSLHHPNHSKP